jgi:hypothetical protein
MNPQVQSQVLKDDERTLEPPHTTDFRAGDERSVCRYSDTERNLLLNDFLKAGRLKPRR